MTTITELARVTAYVNKELVFNAHEIKVESSTPTLYLITISQRIQSEEYVRFPEVGKMQELTICVGKTTFDFNATLIGFKLTDHASLGNMLTLTFEAKAIK